jgi:hypothetical protein
LRVGADICLTECRHTIRQGGICSAFATAFMAKEAEMKKAIEDSGEISAVAADAIIALNAAPRTPVNPPLKPTETIMSEQVAASTRTPEQYRAQTQAARDAKKMKQMAQQGGVVIKLVDSPASAGCILFFVEETPGSGTFKLRDLSLMEYLEIAGKQKVICATSYKTM